VESRHNQPHMNENPTFKPRSGSPTIAAHVRTEEDGRGEMWRDLANDKLEPNEVDKNIFDEDVDPELEAMAKAFFRQMPTMGIEYDIIACEDFVEDKGCWVRNMPEAVKLANPQWVPT